MTERWMVLLEKAVEADPRGRQGVADRIGFSRGAVSTALAGKYAADPANIARAVMDHLDNPYCPLVVRVIERRICRRTSLIKEPAGGDARLRWLTCQTCPHKPKESP